MPIFHPHAKSCSTSPLYSESCNFFLCCPHFCPHLHFIGHLNFWGHLHFSSFFMSSSFLRSSLFWRFSSFLRSSSSLMSSSFLDLDSEHMNTLFIYCQAYPALMSNNGLAKQRNYPQLPLYPALYYSITVSEIFYTPNIDYYSTC